VSAATVRAHFYGRLNQKLVANRAMLSDVYATAAADGVTFNYPTKKALAWAVDTSDEETFVTLVRRACGQDEALARNLMACYAPASNSETRRLLVAETEKPTKLRKAHQRQVSLDVFESLAGPLVWSLWPPRELHRVTQPLAVESGAYTGGYLSDLKVDKPELFSRDRALVVRHAAPGANYEALRGGLAAWLADEYESVNNYGHVALVIDATTLPGQAWELSADLTLFAERFHEHRIPNSFFRWTSVEEATLRYVDEIDLARADFSRISEGYTYRDLFVLMGAGDHVSRLLLVFQKNRRDETKIPCPACRSADVAGNSYPTLGVKSWECRNALCPERSIYNRGKRYSFKALISQAAIEYPENAIPVASVRRWQRDVVSGQCDSDVVEMLLRHYSIAGDTVVIDSSLPESASSLGRLVRRESFAASHTRPEFWEQAAFFERYAVGSVRTPESSPSGPLTHDDLWAIIQGDSYDVLAQFADDTFDRAVTSPPYFNARAYAQWPNLYCHLHDMLRINAQVFRTLKPGALYAYNVFDYFDNERTVVFSAMGKKRIALSALMMDLFRRIGFEFVGTTVWDKGEIHGKRGFNAGNLSPFYQSPFNCWEHVLVVRKPDPTARRCDTLDCLNQVLRIHPVVKMVRGENLHGHTAPFPVELPQALLEGLEAGSLVLDPFGGSGTTGRAAANLDLRSVMIERDPDYCELSRRLFTEQERSGRQVALC